MSEEFEFEADLIGEEEYRRTFRPPRQARRFPPPQRRHYPRPLLRAGYAGVVTTGSDFVRWVQQCLATALGSGVPQNGVMGPATRRAIRMFQKEQGLPDTGIVDAATEGALREACAAAAVPFEGEEEEGAEQEFQVTGQVAVTITRSPRTDVTALTGGEAGIRQPGIYIIYVNQTPWYVGLAERSVYARFQDRFKSLSDFDIDSKCLDGRQIEWLNVGKPAITGGGVGRRSQKKRQLYRAVPTLTAALSLLEQYLIKSLGTREIKVGKKVVKRGGNKQTEPVHFDSGGALILTEGTNVTAKDKKNPI